MILIQSCAILHLQSLQNLSVTILSWYYSKKINLICITKLLFQEIPPPPFSFKCLTGDTIKCFNTQHVGWRKKKINNILHQLTLYDLRILLAKHITQTANMLSFTMHSTLYTHCFSNVFFHHVFSFSSYNHFPALLRVYSHTFCHIIPSTKIIY